LEASSPKEKQNNSAECPYNFKENGENQEKFKSSRSR